MRKAVFPFAAVLMVALAGSAFAQAPAKTGNSTKGKVLTNTHGMTLYTYADDSKGKSACNGRCAANWPPLMASAGANAGKGYTVITRADGSKQWAYKGKPLYTWKNDHKPGDITGDGLHGGDWKLARP
jgi:predicted lipoprotein with Yx(FWY)xxD motif